MDRDTGRTTILTARVSPGAGPHARTPLILTDDLDIARDGTVYFSDATAFAPPRKADGSYDAMAPTAQTLLKVGHCSSGYNCAGPPVESMCGMDCAHGCMADGCLECQPCRQADVFSQAHGIMDRFCGSLRALAHWLEARRSCNQGDRCTDPWEPSSGGGPAACQGHGAGARGLCTTSSL